MNIEKRKEVCDNAYKYMNVKFRDQGRKFIKDLDLSIEENKNRFNLDCAGLLVETLKDSNLFNEGDDLSNYSRIPDGNSLMMHLHKIADLKHIEEMQIGDIILMAFGGHATHLAFYIGDYFNNGGEYIIHSYLPLRKVTVHRLEEYEEFDVKSAVINKHQIIGVFSIKDIDK